MAATDVKANELTAVTTLSDNYDLILVDKTNNNGVRMDADKFVELTLGTGLLIEEVGETGATS